MPTFEPIVPTPLRLRDLPYGRFGASEVESGGKQWYRYALSYKEAADRLTGLGDTYGLNLLGTPYMFLYRHYLELHLKSLLTDAGELLDDPQAIPPEHYILSLWKRVRKLLLKISPESDGEWFVRADEIIADFDQLDPRSFAFRYPVDKDGKPSLPEELFLDRRVVKRMVEELHILLDGASGQISEYMSLKNEY
jgi:hypothetical protein